jgi:hypothetical protein
VKHSGDERIPCSTSRRQLWPRRRPRPHTSQCSRRCPVYGSATTSSTWTTFGAPASGRASITGRRTTSASGFRENPHRALRNQGRGRRRPSPRLSLAWGEAADRVLRGAGAGHRPQVTARDRPAVGIDDRGASESAVPCDGAGRSRARARGRRPKPVPSATPADCGPREPRRPGALASLRYAG